MLRSWKISLNGVVLPRGKYVLPWIANNNADALAPDLFCNVLSLSHVSAPSSLGVLGLYLMLKSDLACAS